ncbi:MAG TPA: sulfatase-like hydrolase/transferase [Thermoanaerobaculia bacterium]|nr:sulfatase-like hydrolase/transferase [Thermoanaerobaculia bacterium]
MRRPFPARAAAALAATCAFLLLGAGALFWWMEKRPAPGVSGAGPGLSAAQRAAAPTSTGPAHPGPFLAGADVLLITIDTLRADCLGFTGNRQVETPVLDRLAGAGRVFTDAHAHNVITLPSHTNILTGLYPYQHGVRENSGFSLAPALPTLATILKQAGYATGAFVGAYPLDAHYGLNHGFDVYDDRFPRGSNPDEFAFAERRGSEVVGPALRWWNAHRGGRRFLWVHLYDPHAPYDPPPPFASRYRDRPYLGEVAAVDSFLAPLLTPILERKEPPALVVMTGDHGESLGEHGELSHGLFAYEATLKIPLVVWGPGIEPARDTRAARHIDIAPTILKALGITAPRQLPGRSLLLPAEREDTYFEALTTSLNRGWAPLRGLLRAQRKFIDLPLPELYNLDDDPKEARNLFDRDRPTARALLQALPAESVWPPAKGRVTPEEEARLRSLGYGGGRAAAGKRTFTAADDPKALIAVDRKLHDVIEAYSRRRYEDAVRLARECIAARPDFSEAYENLALSLRQLERPEEAIEALRAGLAHGGDRDALSLQLGLALSESGRAAEAVSVLTPLASHAGTESAEVLNALGIALSDAGKNPEALKALERAKKAEPENAKTLENMGIVLLRMNRREAARDRLQEALKLNERLPISWNTLGVALFQSGDARGALHAWQRAVELDPRQVDALYNLGLVAADTGEAAAARNALERFIRTAPPERWSAEIARARQVLAHLGA